MSQTRQLVAQTVINDLFQKSFFSICKVDNLVSIVDGSRNTEAYKLLRALHCVDYADMPQDLKRQLPQLLNEALTSHTQSQQHPATDIVLKNIQF